MRHANLRWMSTSATLCMAGIVAVALVCSSILAGEGETKKVLKIKPASTETASGSGTRVLKLDRNGGALPWIDLAAIIGDVKGEIKVTGTIPLPDDFPRAASLTEGAVIKTFENKSVTTAADMIAQYDKLKTGDSVTLSYELKGQTDTIKFVKPKRAGNLMMLKK